MSSFTRTFILVVLSFILSLTYSQNSNDSFEQIRLGTGLDINCVTDMAEGPAAYRWFTTWTGLYRYDGYEFKGYTIDRKMKSGREVDFVEIFVDSKDRIWSASSYYTCIYSPQQDSLIAFGPSMLHGPHQKYNRLFLEDSQGNIWRSSRQGVQKILTARAQEDTFPLIHYKPDPEDEHALPHAVVNSMLHDAQGKLWLGTYGGLCSYDAEHDRFDLHPAFADKMIISLHAGEAGNLFIGTADGFSVLNVHTGAVTHFPSQEGKQGHLQGKQIHKIVQTDTAHVWLLTSNMKALRFWLECLNPATGSVTQFLSPFSCKMMPKIISSQIGGDKEGRLWFCNESGMYRYDPGSELFEKVKGIELNKSDLGWADFWYEDSQGILWIGFLKHGLFKYAPARNKFHLIRHEPDNPNSISTDELNFIYTDREGWIWITPKSGGTEKIRLNERYEIVEIKKYDWNARVSGEDKAGKLWVHLKGGVSLFDPQTETFVRHIKYDPIQPGGLPNPNVAEVIESRDGKWWLTTYGGGMCLYDPQTKQMEHFPYKPGDSTALPSAISGPMFYGPDSSLWIATGSGLCRYNEATHDFTTFLRGIMLASHYIHPDSTIWITSINYGLFHLYPKTGKVVRYTQENSPLPTNRTNSIRFDTDGRLWISTDAGIVLLDPKNDFWYTFDEDDGVSSTSFTIFHARQLPGGEIVWGTEDAGLIVIRPDDMKFDLGTLQTELTHFRLLGEPNPEEKPNPWEKEQLLAAKYQGKALELNHDQNLFFLKFSGMEFRSPSAQTYVYKLEGDKETDWASLGRTPALNLALPPGQYDVSVKSYDFEGNASLPFTLPVRIHPPWYFSKVAYASYIILFMVILWALYQNQKRRWRLKADLEWEHQEAARLKELDTFKNRFYTHITHEFRTPLTTILGMVDEMGHASDAWLETGREMIRRNAKRLLRLIRDMLDIASLEAGTMSVNRVHGDIIPFLRYVLESFESVAATKNIELHFDTTAEKIEMDFDQDKLESILSNLLSNGIKFTPKGGTIRVKVAEYAQNDRSKGRFLQLIVEDTGRGIPAADLENVFDRFYQVANGHEDTGSGTGIGLALTRELTHLLGGEIQVESEIGKGTSFELRLPISHEGKELTWEKESMKENGEPPLQVILPDTLVEKQGTGLPQLLLVEDNEDVMQYLHAILANDYQLISARDGLEGLEKAQEYIPDLIVSDVMMPRMDGFELCSKLKTDIRTSHIPIILLTAKADQASKIEGLEQGADAYLAKPFAREELFVRLAKLHELRLALHQHYGNPELPPAPTVGQYAKEQDFIRNIRQIIWDHLHEEAFNTEMICKEIGMSRSQLYRKFSSLTGMGLAKYRQELQLTKAYELLLEGRLSIAEVATAVGFKNAAHFSTSFSKRFGKAPSAI